MLFRSCGPAGIVDRAEAVCHDIHACAELKDDPDRQHRDSEAFSGSFSHGCFSFPPAGRAYESMESMIFLNSSTVRLPDIVSKINPSDQVVVMVSLLDSM